MGRNLDKLDELLTKLDKLDELLTKLDTVAGKLDDAIARLQAVEDKLGAGLPTTLDSDRMKVTSL